MTPLPAPVHPTQNTVAVSQLYVKVVKDTATKKP